MSEVYPSNEYNSIISKTILQRVYGAKSKVTSNQLKALEAPKNCLNISAAHRR